MHPQFIKCSPRDPEICFLANGETFVKETKCCKKSETFFVSRKQKMFPQQTFPVHANGKKHVSSFVGNLRLLKQYHHESGVLIGSMD